MEASISKLRKADLIKRIQEVEPHFNKRMTVPVLKEYMKQVNPIRPHLERIIVNAGHKVLWLPPYHPQFNPIEKIWSMIKKRYRKMFDGSPMTVELVRQRIEAAVASITTDEWSKTVGSSWDEANMMWYHHGLNLAPSEESDAKRSSTPASINESSEIGSVGSSSAEEQEFEFELPATLSERKEAVAEMAATAGLLPPSSSGRVRYKPIRSLEGAVLSAREAAVTWGNAAVRAPALVHKL